MTTETGRYEHSYSVKNFELFAQPIRLAVVIGPAKYPIVGAATVEVFVRDTHRVMDRSDSFEDFRYVFINKRFELDVSYKEDGGFNGIARI